MVRHGLRLEGRVLCLRARDLGEGFGERSGRNEAYSG